MILAHYDANASGTVNTAGYHPAGWYSMYTSNSRNYYKALASDETHYRVYEVKAKYSITTGGQEFADLLANDTNHLNVVAAIDNSVEDFSTTYATAMKVWAVNGDTLGSIAAPGSNVNMTIPVKNLSTSYTTIGYVIHYVDGADSSVASLDGAVEITTGIKVTGSVSGTAATIS